MRSREREDLDGSDCAREHFVLLGLVGEESGAPASGVVAPENLVALFVGHAGEDLSVLFEGDSLHHLLGEEVVPREARLFADI